MASAGARIADDHLQYGVAPAGFWASTPEPEPLRPGILYLASISGGGYVGGVYFANISGILVSEPGSGDLPERRMRARLG